MNKSSAMRTHKTVLSLVLLSLCAVVSATATTAIAPSSTAVTAPASAAVAVAANNEVTLTLKDHQYSPARIQVATGKRIKLIIKNEDATPEEFESKSLGREKIVQGKSQTVIYVGPLKKGSYQFGGEYHEKTAQGVLIAE